NLAHPGGNTTGFINLDFNFAVKSLELLKEVAPRATRAAVLRPAGLQARFDVIKAAASSLKVEASAININDVLQLERDVMAFAQEPGGGLIVIASTIATKYREEIVALAARHRLPAVYPNRFYVAGGGLISYGPFFLDQYRHAADYVDRILKGAKPGDLPVQAPTRFETVLNLRTARQLGLPVPRILLARADEVIE